MNLKEFFHCSLLFPRTTRFFCQIFSTLFTEHSNLVEYLTVLEVLLYNTSLLEVFLDI